MKTKYYISLGDSEPKLTPTTRELIRDSLQVWDGKTTNKSNLKYAQTYSRLASDGFGGSPNPRRCLLYLTEMQRDGFFTSKFPSLVKFKEGNVATVRMFTRIK